MWYIVIFTAALILDQVTKIAVAAYSGVAGEVVGSKHLFWLIKDFIEITYSENRNGAMGLFGGVKFRQIGFIVATVIILGGIAAYLIFSKKKRKPWLNVTLSLITSGAIGNFIDRLTTVYVRDFIHVIIPIGKNKDIFPYIFNVADMALVVGSIMLVVYLFFIDDDAIFKKKAPVETSEKKDE